MHGFHPCPQATGVLFWQTRSYKGENMKKLRRLLLAVLLSSLVITGLLLMLQSTSAQATAAPDQAEVIQAGLAYLQAQQQADGGITGFSGVSDPDTTARSVLAFISAGTPVSAVVSIEGKSMLDYLSAQAISYTHDMTGTLFPGRTGILLTAVVLAGDAPTAFGGINLAGELDSSFHPDTSAYSTTAQQDFSNGAASDLSQAWAILGLSLAGRSIPEAAPQYLIKSQAEDGSWGAGDPDTTALAVTALLASRKVNSQDQTIQKAISYFHNTQADSGGWRPAWDTDPLNADSTGWILQALVSAGEDLRGQNWLVNSINPLDALMSLQKPDGSIGGTYANTYSTAEAIIGLSGIPLSNLGTVPAVYRAGLALYWGDNSLYTTCISFTESSISGLDLLQQSGLAVETATNPTQGTAVCKIGEVGSPSNDCFGSMPNYWAFFQMGAAGWEYSVTGAEKGQVIDGSVNAWSWGMGDAPALITFQNICEGVAYVLPTAVESPVVPTDTSEPSPVPTLVHATLPPQITPTPLTVQKGVATYIVYASILLVLGVLIIYLIRSRGK
jgi:hypothetical protein